MGKLAKGWDRVPYLRIVSIKIDAGAKLLLMAQWAHADWSGPPGEVYGFVWASLPTLAKETRESERTSWKRLAKLVDVGFVVSLENMTPGELHIANTGRKKAGLDPIRCRCRQSKAPRPQRNECSCRVLRPISVDGKLIREPPGSITEIDGPREPRRSFTGFRKPPSNVIEINGLHVGSTRAKVKRTRAKVKRGGDTDS